MLGDVLMRWFGGWWVGERLAVGVGVGVGVLVLSVCPSIDFTLNGHSCESWMRAQCVAVRFAWWPKFQPCEMKENSIENGLHV